jgi:hypothetical protein
MIEIPSMEWLMGIEKFLSAFKSGGGAEEAIVPEIRDF